MSRPLLVGLAISGLLHAGLLAWVDLPAVEGWDSPAPRWSFSTPALPPEVRIPPPPAALIRPRLPRAPVLELEEGLVPAPRLVLRKAGQEISPPPVVTPPGRPSFVRPYLPPLLSDRREMERVLKRFYPHRLRRRGIQGAVELFLLVDRSGDVVASEIKASSGHEPLDAAARKAARHLRYAPAMARDNEVGVWVAQKICFVLPRGGGRPMSPEECRQWSGGGR